MTALCVACANGQAETAQVLLHHGATIDFQNLVRTYKYVVLVHVLSLSLDLYNNYLHGEMW